MLLSSTNNSGFFVFRVLMKIRKRFSFFEVFRFWKYLLYAFLGYGWLLGLVLTQKSIDEIRKLVHDAKLDFVSVQYDALNAYLSRIFHICPFSEDVCTGKQCADCVVFKESLKKK